MREARPGRVAAATVLLLLLGVSLRLFLLERLGDSVDPDEAVVALMARHIGRGESAPVFYYGQPYLGALEAWIGSLSAPAGQVSARSIRLTLIATWLLLALATLSLARAVGASPLLALALIAIPAPDVLLWQLKFRGGFVLGAALLALALALGLRGRPLGFGLAAGLAFWTNQQTLPALALVGLVLWRRGPGPPRGRLALGFLLGSLPLWIENLRQPLATFRYLAAHAFANLPEQGRHTRTLLLETLPRLVGGASFAILPVALVGIALGLLVVRRARGILRALRAREPLEPLDLLLLAFLVLLPARRNAELNQCLHWIAPAAVLLAALPGRRPRLGGLAAAVVLGSSLLHLAWWLPGFRAGAEEARELVRYLDDLGIEAVHAEHRPAYLLAWHSGERIAATPDLSYGWFVDRWPPYTERVRRAPRAAYVVEGGSPGAARLAELLAAHGETRPPRRIGRYLVHTDVAAAPEALTEIARPSGRADEQAVELRLLLAGDAGHPWLGDARAMMDALAADAADPRAARRVVAWLGDNVYDRGLPAPAERSEERGRLEEVLDQQIESATAGGALGVFVPGNHDWDRSGPRGMARVLAQGEYLRARGQGRAALLPEGACPGPSHVDHGERLRLVALDSEWFLRPEADPASGVPWKPWGAGTGCRFGPAAQPGEREYDFLAPDAVMVALAEAVATAGERDVVVVFHHPVRSVGPHATRGGGALPCASRQDLCGERYREWIGRIDATLRAVPRRGLLLTASGHDHSLQVIPGEGGGGPDFYLVSGAAAAPTSVAPAAGVAFASSRPGYLCLDWLAAGGRRLRVHEASPGGERRIVWEQRLEPAPSQ